MTSGSYYPIVWSLYHWNPLLTSLYHVPLPKMFFVSTWQLIAMNPPGLIAPPPSDEENDLAKLLPHQPRARTPKAGRFLPLDFYIDVCSRQIAHLWPKILEAGTSTWRPVNRRPCRIWRIRQTWWVNPADKGGTVVVWCKDLYIKDATKQLSDKCCFYSEIPKGTTKADNVLVRKTVKAQTTEGHLPRDALSPINKKPQESQFYLLCKIHKPNNPQQADNVCMCMSHTALSSDFMDKNFPATGVFPVYLFGEHQSYPLVAQHFSAFTGECPVINMHHTAPHCTIRRHCSHNSIKCKSFWVTFLFKLIKFFSTTLFLSRLSSLMISSRDRPMILWLFLKQSFGIFWVIKMHISLHGTNGGGMVMQGT